MLDCSRDCTALIQSLGELRLIEEIVVAAAEASAGAASRTASSQRRCCRIPKAERAARRDTGVLNACRVAVSPRDSVCDHEITKHPIDERDGVCSATGDREGGRFDEALRPTNMRELSNPGETVLKLAGPHTIFHLPRTSENLSMHSSINWRRCARLSASGNTRLTPR